MLVFLSHIKKREKKKLKICIPKPGFSTYNSDFIAFGPISSENWFPIYGLFIGQLKFFNVVFGVSRDLTDQFSFLFNGGLHYLIHNSIA